MTKFGRITRGEGHISRGSAMHLPPLQGWGPSDPQFWGSLMQNYQILLGDIWGGGLFIGGQPYPLTEGLSPSTTQFGGSSLCMTTL